MKRSLIIPLVAALLMPVTLVAAFAAGAADGQVTLPIGDWINSGISILDQVVVPVVAVLAGWAIKKLPDSIGGYLKGAQVDQLLVKAIGYATNAVAGAAQGAQLNVNVGNKVVAEAVQYAVDHAPKLVEWAGGSDMLAQKIIARLNIEPSALVTKDADTGQTVLAK